MCTYAPGRPKNDSRDLMAASTTRNGFEPTYEPPAECSMEHANDNERVSAQVASRTAIISSTMVRRSEANVSALSADEKSRGEKYHYEKSRRIPRGLVGQYSFFFFLSAVLPASRASRWGGGKKRETRAHGETYFATPSACKFSFFAKR